MPREKKREGISGYLDKGSLREEMFKHCDRRLIEGELNEIRGLIYRDQMPGAKVGGTKSKQSIQGGQKRKQGMRKEISAPKAVVPKSAPRGDNMEAPIPERKRPPLKRSPATLDVTKGFK